MKLSKLNLSLNHIGDDGLKMIAEGIRLNETLRVITIADAGITKISIPPFARSLSNKRFLTKVLLDSNKIGPEGSSRLASYLLSNTSVTALDCSSNPLGDEGVAAIFQSITVVRAEFEQDADGILPTTYNRTLTSLDCGATDLGHEAAAALINVFRDNES
jgi:Ran GTPase-activating protein (RanGAP) involved in mRNA processing and transport